jgi:drug/metabolite transporter (DMT)-like permease
MSHDPLTLPQRTAFVDNAPLMVFLLLILDSMHFIYARLLLPLLPPTTSAMYVLGIATVQVAIFLLVWDRIHFEFFWRHRWYFLIIGFLVAASTALNFTAIAYIDPGTASLLAKSSILFALGLGVIWLRERLTLVQSIGTIIAIAGVFIISFQRGDFLRLGSFMVLVSTFMYALHAAVVKRQQEEIRLAEFFLFRLATTTAFLFLFALSQQQLVWPGYQAWLVLLLTGTFDVVISRTLYYVALRRLDLSFHSLVLTLSPVITVGWTLLFFEIRPTIQQISGGVAVLVGVIIVTMSRAHLARGSWRR